MNETQQTPRRSSGDFSSGRFAFNVAATVLLLVLTVMYFMNGKTVQGVIAALLLVWNLVVTRQEWSKRR